MKKKHGLLLSCMNPSKREFHFVRLFTLFVVFVTAFNLNAIPPQTWDDPTPDGTTVVSGTGFYVYNVGAKAFLDRGGDYATQAIVFPSEGALVKPVDASSLWSLEFESSSKTLFCSDINGGMFTDNNVNNGTSTNNQYTLSVTDAVNNIYSIQVRDTYTPYNASQYVGVNSTLYTATNGGNVQVYKVMYNQTAGNYTQWKFCTADAVAKFNAKVKLDQYMKIAKLVGGTIDLTSYINTYNTGTTAEIITAANNLNTALTPVDKTSSITNPDFSSALASPWSYTTNNAGLASSNVQYFQKIGKIYQAVSSLPAGVYIMKAQGFERPWGLSATAQSWYAKGWDSRAASLYVTASGTTTSIPLRSAYSDTTCTSSGGTTYTGGTLYYPNSQAQAQVDFDAGLYDNELPYFIVDASGTATIGLQSAWKKNNTTYAESEWVVADNFRLYYYGALAIPNISLSKSSQFLSSAVSNTTTFDIIGANLTADVTLTVPSGITLSGANVVDNGGGSYKIALANANATNTITATWDGAAAITDNIIVTSSGATTQNFGVTTSRDAECITKLYSDKTNIIVDPYCNDLANFGGWGARSIETGYVYCGARSIKITGKCGGSLDFSLTGKIEAGKTYRVKAMVSTNGSGEAKIGVGNGSTVISTNPVSTIANEWKAVDFVFTAPATLTTPNLYFNSCETQTATQLYIDNFEMYEIAAPIVTVAEATIPGFVAGVGSSDVKTINVSGSDLIGDVAFALSGTNADQFSLSTASLTPVSGTLNSTAVTVTYTPTEYVTSHTATLTVSSFGAASVVYTLSATSPVTSVAEMSTGFKTIVAGGVLIVQGVEDYSVYNVQGVLIADVNDNSKSAFVKLAQGVYLVKSGNQVLKVIIR